MRAVPSIQRLKAHVSLLNDYDYTLLALIQIVKD
jgi:hypothetical protein